MFVDVWFWNKKKKIKCFKIAGFLFPKKVEIKMRYFTTSMKVLYIYYFFFH